MPESQEDIDALLAEVNALADEAVAEIVGDETTDDDAAVAVSQAEPPRRADHAPTDQPTAATPPAAPTPPRSYTNLDRLLHLKVPIIVQLARRTMPLSEIIGLSTGAIIEFEKPADSDLDLIINNKCIGQGQAVKVTENFGLRVTRIGSLQSRIRAMGQ
ncbi:MAG: FliM/FliN family flagellar motor switch protein [Phycisphaerae bacterium]|nr:FliM/FliN family flagellar motor switch protein [Phycisphaerae bacterium]